MMKVNPELQANRTYRFLKEFCDRKESRNVDQRRMFGLLLERWLLTSSLEAQGQVVQDFATAFLGKNVLHRFFAELCHSGIGYPESVELIDLYGKIIREQTKLSLA